MANVECTVKDQSTGNNCPVEGIGVTSAPANPGAGKIIRQVMAIGDGSDTTNYVKVSSGGQLQTQDGGSRARTNYSGNIATGGTAQNVFTAGQASNGFYFQNTSSYPMYLRQDGTAATATTGLYIGPNGFFQTGSADGAPTTLISVFCATSTATYYCETW